MKTKIRGGVYTKWTSLGKEINKTKKRRFNNLVKSQGKKINSLVT
jgi:hypothetical protein